MNTGARSILVVHCEGLGDSVLSIPFLSLALNTFNNHQLYLLTGTRRRDLFRGLPRLNVIESHEATAITELLSLQHDMVFDLGTGPQHITEWLVGAELKYHTYVGFRKPKTIHREVVVSRLTDGPRWKQFISLISALGISVSSEWKFEAAPSELSRRYADVLMPSGSDEPLVAIAPGASCDHRKRWPPDNFAAVIRELNSRRHCMFALLGAQEDQPLGQAIVHNLEFEIDNLIGLTTLGSVAHILGKSHLLLANDNGIMHLGGLINTPTLGIYGPSDPVTWHPLGTRSMILNARSGNISAIDPSTVLRECVRLLGWNQ